jgi:hypothetical protein
MVVISLMMRGVGRHKAAPHATDEPQAGTFGLNEDLDQFFKIQKTSSARWHGSMASGSASLMSSPGARASCRVGVGCSPIRFCCGRLSFGASGRMLFGVRWPIQKARDRFPGAGFLILAMLNICR